MFILCAVEIDRFSIDAGLAWKHLLWNLGQKAVNFNRARYKAGQPRLIHRRQTVAELLALETESAVGG